MNTQVPEGKPALGLRGLNQRIGRFYDQSTPLWLKVWGEHMHHGFYGADGRSTKNNRQAQIDLIEELLCWGGISEARRILDAGCGVGGSARHLARRYGAQVLGLTLSLVQAERGRRLTEKAGLEQQVRLDVRDMMTIGAADGPFDLVWSLESAEHIADKQGLFHRFFQVLEPGGQLLMVTWCHRPLPPELSPADRQLLDRLGKLYHLPPMASLPQLEDMAERAGFTELSSTDWTAAVAPFWGAVLRSALQPGSVMGLFQAGVGTLKGAWAMRYMIQGYRRGLIRFGVLQGRKPS